MTIKRTVRDYGQILTENAVVNKTNEAHWWFHNVLSSRIYIHIFSQTFANSHDFLYEKYNIHVGYCMYAQLIEL